MKTSMFLVAGRGRRHCCFLEEERYHQHYRSWILLSLAILIASVSPGLVYGWPALRLQLQADGSTLREEQLGLLYTVGAWSTQGGRFFWGLARDRFGTRIVACASLFVLSQGIVGISIAGPNQMVLLAMSMVGVGLGSGAMLCVQPVAGLFPNHTGIVLSTISGFYQISGLLFFVLTSGKASRRISFLAFAASVLMLTVLAAFLLPNGNSFEPERTTTTKQDDDDEERATEKTKDDSECSEENDRFEDNESSTSPLDSIEPDLVVVVELSNGVGNDLSTTLGSPSSLDQMKTTEYVLLLTWFCIGAVPHLYYVGTIGFQLEELGDDTGFYTSIFSYCYAGSAIVAPFIGTMIDRFGLAISQGLATVAVMIPHFLLANKDHLDPNAQIAGFVLSSIGGLGIWGSYFTNCGKRFGYANYGTLAGFGLLASAIASFLQYPLITWTVRGYSDIVNWFLAGVLLLPAPYFVWLYRREREFDWATCK